MHRSRTESLLSPGSRRGRGIDGAEQPSSHDADASPADGGTCHAVASIWRCKPNHPRGAQRSGGQAKAGREILERTAFRTQPNSHHLWLSLPRHWNSRGFLSHVARHGMALVGEDTFAVGDTSSHAVRVSLGAARNRAELAAALQFLAAAMKSSVASLQIV